MQTELSRTELINQFAEAVRRGNVSEMENLSMIGFAQDVDMFDPNLLEECTNSGALKSLSRMIAYEAVRTNNPDLLARAHAVNDGVLGMRLLNGSCLLSRAALDSEGCVKYILDNSPDIDIDNGGDYGMHDFSPLAAAMGRSTPIIIRMLLERGASIEGRPTTPEMLSITPLGAAIINLSLVNIKILIENGARTDKYGLIRLIGDSPVYCRHNDINNVCEILDVMLAAGVRYKLSELEYLERRAVKFDRSGLHDSSELLLGAAAHLRRVGAANMDQDTV